jgi:hypothetical protein
MAGLCEYKAGFGHGRQKLRIDTTAVAVIYETAEKFRLIVDGFRFTMNTPTIYQHH